MRFSVFLVLSIICYLPTIGQTKLGLKISPSISSNRILTDDRDFEVENNGSELRVKFGLETDFPIGDNYAFGTGIFYSPKRFSYTATIPTLTGFPNMSVEEYKLQYLEVPVTIKLFTSDIQPDLKMYFQTGGLLDIKIFEDNIADDEDSEIRNFKPYDVAFIFGTGIEYKAGVNTILVAGISYERGLVNVIGKTDNLPDDLSGRNDMISLNVGIRF